MRKNAKRRLACLVVASLLSAPSFAAPENTVVVKPGDTLSKIAARELGRRDRYGEICWLNWRTLGGECDYLTEGMVLKLPVREDARKMAVRGAVPTNRQPKVARSTANNNFVAAFSPTSGQTLNAPAGYAVTPADDFVTLSGYTENATSQGRPGIWLQLPDAIENLASGKQVIIRARIRSATEGLMQLAYSTNEVGNSGWVTRQVGSSFAEVWFTYRVAPMRIGNGDFIGILPDPENTGQVLDVAEISVSVAAR